MRVALSDGTEIIATDVHPFWTPDNRQWTPAGELLPGTALDTLRGELTVRSVEPLRDAAAVYNIEVNGHHVYRVADVGVLVHNTCSDHSRKLRSNLEADGRPVLVDEDAAHIVASSHPRHSEARDILTRAGIDVDDAINGGGLPSNTIVSNPHGKTTHNVTHRHLKMDEVTDLLREAEVNGVVFDTLRAIEKMRQDGTF